MGSPPRVVLFLNYNFFIKFPVKLISPRLYNSAFLNSTSKYRGFVVRRNQFKLSFSENETSLSRSVSLQKRSFSNFFAACKNSIVSVLDESEGPYTAGHPSSAYLFNELANDVSSDIPETLEPTTQGVKNQVKQKRFF